MAVIGSWTHTPTSAAVVPSAGWVSNLAQIKTAVNTIDQAQMNTDSVGTAQIIALNVTAAKIAADAIDGSKIADDAIDSEHYVDGSIDNQHIANATITSAKLANMFEAFQVAEQATDTVAETSWHDLVNATATVVLEVTSSLVVHAMFEMDQGADYGASLRIVYDTGSGAVQIGGDIDADQSIWGAGAHGVATNLAADSYTVKLQAKVASNSANFVKYSLCGFSIPYQA